MPFLADAAAGVRRDRRRRRVLERAALPAALPREPRSTRCCSPSASCSWSIAAATWVWGPSQQPVRLPRVRCTARSPCCGVDLGAYRLFLIGFVRRAHGGAGLADRRARASARSCAPRSTTRRPPPAWASTSIALQRHLRARLGAGGPGRRAGASTCSGWIRPSRSSTWSTSCWSWCRRRGSIQGSLVAALLLGVADVAGKYYVPADRRLHHLRIDGRAADAVPARASWPPRPDGRPTPAIARARAGIRWRSRSGSRRVAAFFVVPDRPRCSAARSSIAGAVRAVAGSDPRLRGDPVARPRGVLRHRRLHGGAARASTAGPSRCRGLLAAARRRGGRRLRGQLLVVRGSDLARLMVTLGIGLLLYEVANQASSITGGVDGLSGMPIGALLRPFPLRPRRARPRTSTASRSCSLVFVLARRLVHSPFGLALARHPRERAAHAGHRRRRQPAPAGGLHDRRRHRRVAGALLAQTTQFVGIDTLGFQRSAELLIMLVLGGPGGSTARCSARRCSSVAQDCSRRHQPGLLAVLAGRGAGAAGAGRAGRPARRARRAPPARG